MHRLFLPRSIETQWTRVASAITSGATSALASGASAITGGMVRRSPPRESRPVISRTPSKREALAGQSAFTVSARSPSRGRSRAALDQSMLPVVD
eukprot:COSAG01_NODE_2646_length_7319_cov_2.926316_5_plen_95_part_00